MTRERTRLENLEDALIENILEASDEEIWQEFVEDCGSEQAAIEEMAKIRTKFDLILQRAKREALELKQARKADNE